MSEAKIYFKYTNAPYGFLSNFSLHPTTIENRIFPTSEHYYQSLKFTDLSVQEKIRNCSTAKSAAMFGRTLQGIRPDWDKVKLDTMRMVIRVKADQYPFIKDELIKTGSIELVELSNKDKFWGQDLTGLGQNWLGKLWMELREELRELSIEPDPEPLRF